MRIFNDNVTAQRSTVLFGSPNWVLLSIPVRKSKVTSIPIYKDTAQIINWREVLAKTCLHQLIIVRTQRSESNLESTLICKLWPLRIRRKYLTKLITSISRLIAYIEGGCPLLRLIRNWQIYLKNHLIILYTNCHVAQDIWITPHKINRSVLCELLLITLCVLINNVSPPWLEQKTMVEIKWAETLVHLIIKLIEETMSLLKTHTDHQRRRTRRSDRRRNFLLKFFILNHRG